MMIISSLKPLVIGVAGASASGKTLLVSNLMDTLGDDSNGENQPALLKEDWYYMDQSNVSIEDRKTRNYDHPNAFEHGLMIKQLDQLTDRQTIMCPQYDFAGQTRYDQSLAVHPADVIIIDGILLLAVPEICRRLDIAIFVDTPLDICLIRRIKRDMKERNRDFDHIIEQYERSVRPMYYQFVEPSKINADIVVTGGGENWIAIDMIKSRINQQVFSALQDREN